MRGSYIPQFEPVRKAAHDLGVPLAWLSREARAGRIPSLTAGRRLLVDVSRVAKVLARRAQRKGAK